MLDVCHYRSSKLLRCWSSYVKCLVVISAAGHKLQAFLSKHWKHICLGCSRPRLIVTNLFSCTSEVHLLTYLLCVWLGGGTGCITGVWWWHAVSAVVTSSGWLLVQRGNSQLQHHLSDSTASSTPARTTAGGRRFRAWRPSPCHSVADQRVFGTVKAVCGQSGDGACRCSHRWQHGTERRPSQRRRHMEEPRPAVDRKGTGRVGLRCRQPWPSQPEGPGEKSRCCPVRRDRSPADGSKPFPGTGDVHPARGVRHRARRVRYQLYCVRRPPPSPIPLQGLRIVDGRRGLDLDRSRCAEAECGECGMHADADAGRRVRWSGVPGDDGRRARGRRISAAAASAAEARPSAVCHSELDCIEVARSTVQHRSGADGVDGDAAGGEIGSTSWAAVLGSWQHRLLARQIFQIGHHVRHGLGMRRTRRSPFQSRTGCVFWWTARVCCLTSRQSQLFIVTPVHLLYIFANISFMKLTILCL